jgi:hypothetical protein
LLESLRNNFSRRGWTVLDQALTIFRATVIARRRPLLDRDVATVSMCLKALLRVCWRGFFP